MNVAYTQKLFRCFYYFEKDFMAYNLKDLYLDNRHEHLEFDYSSLLSKGKLWVNICDGLTIPEQCNSQKVADSSIIYIPDNSGADCKTLLSSKVDENNYSLLSSDNKKNGFSIASKNTSTSDFQVIVKCDKSKKKPEYVLTNNTLTITTEGGCGTINEPARVFYNNKIVFSLIFMAVGIIFMVFGGWKWDKLLVGVGFLAGASFVFFIFWAFVQYEPSTKSYVIISVISVLIGGIIAYLCKLFDFLSYMCIGFFGAFFLTRFLIATFPTHGLENWVVQLITYSVAAVCALICVFVGKYFMVIITATIGSFLFWYNFGFLVGLLPNMFDFFEKFKTYGKLDGWNIALLVVAGLTAFGFYIFQYKMIAKDNKRSGTKAETLI